MSVLDRLRSEAAPGAADRGEDGEAGKAVCCRRRTEDGLNGWGARRVEVSERQFA